MPILPKVFKTACIGLIAWGGIGAASAAAYSGLYVFGDSLSDTGNIYIASQGTLPVSPPYSDGRFSNGNLWVQDVAASLGLGPVTPALAGGNDYAFGGAETGTTLAHAGTTTDLTAQLRYYNASSLAAQPNALYSLWIGSNDVNALLTALAKVPAVDQASYIKTDIGQAVGNIAGVVNGLAADGMKNLLALNVPDIGKTPDAVAAGVAAEASALAADFNVALTGTLTGLAAQDGFKLNLIDTYASLDSIVSHPQANGLTNVTDPCWTGSFTDPNSGTLCAPTQAGQDKYLFWDGLHPTAAGHQLIADAVLAQVPEPGSAGLLVIAIAGVALVRRQNRKASPVLRG